MSRPEITNRNPDSFVAVDFEQMRKAYGYKTAKPPSIGTLGKALIKAAESSTTEAGEKVKRQLHKMFKDKRKKNKHKQ